MSFTTVNVLRPEDITAALQSVSAVAFVQPSEQMSGVAVPFTVAVNISYAVLCVNFSVFGKVASDGGKAAWLQVGSVAGTQRVYASPVGGAASASLQYFTLAAVNRCVCTALEHRPALSVL